MGTAGFGAHMHVDHVGLARYTLQLEGMVSILILILQKKNIVSIPSWQAQIRGSKKWSLEPPPECYYQCQRSIEVILHPGDTSNLSSFSFYLKQYI